MRKLVIVLLAAGSLATGAAFAQGMGTGLKPFGGVSFGVEELSGVSSFPVAVHVGAYNIGIENLGVRVDAGYWLGYPFFNIIGLGLDVLYKYPVGDSVSVYGGLGPRMIFGTTGGGTAWGVGVVAGAEYMVTPKIGITGEANVAPYFQGTGSATTFGLSVGANYYF